MKKNILYVSLIIMITGGMLIGLTGCTSKITVETDGENVILKEKIIYPVCTINADKVTYNCTVHRDFEHTVNIGEVKEVEKNYNFNLSNYNDCNIIEYTFTKNIDSYHVFNSSKIVY